MAGAPPPPAPARRGAHARRRRQPPRWIAVVALLAVVAVVVVMVTSGGSPPPHPSTATTHPATAAPGGHHPTATTGTTATTATAPGTAHRAGARGGARTFLGPYGVESEAIIAENRRPGTTAWQISGAPASGFIEGFADLNYAAVGQSVGLYVSTDAPRFRVVAYRMGYYGGKGGRQVWASGWVPGTAQPLCPLTADVNMVSCDNWTRSLSVPITAAFMSGDYLFKLVGRGGQQAYVPLTVWDPTSHATYLMMARSLTEEGWNTFGGYSYYQGTGPCPPGAASYPVCNRARIVSFDRPYAGDGASDFLSNEYPLVRLAEQHGLDITYATDITVDEHPSMLLDHRVLMSPGHDETWTYAEREGAQTALDHGVNIIFFGAAAVLRHSRLQASPLGPDREEVDYRDNTEDPLNGVGNPMEVTGNTWSSPPTDWSEVPFVGELYSGYMEPNTGTEPLVVWDPSSWLFKGTGLQAGSQVPGVVESDFDHIDPPSDLPANIEVLAHSPVPLSTAYTNEGEWGADTYADTTYYDDPTSKGGVFDSGTVNWINALSPCPAGTPAASCPATLLDKITGNLLWLFGQGPAGDLEPSVPNWQSVTPAGS